MDIAPKDGNCVLLNVGMPWLVYGCWNEHEQAWVHTDIQVNFISGEPVDPYFENEYCKEPIWWKPVLEWSE